MLLGKWAHVGFSIDYRGSANLFLVRICWPFCAHCVVSQNGKQESSGKLTAVATGPTRSLSIGNTKGFQGKVDSCAVWVDAILSSSYFQELLDGKQTSLIDWL